MKNLMLAAVVFTTTVALGQELCGTHKFIEKRAQSSPDLKRDYDAMFLQLQDLKNKGVSASRDAKPIIYIPVVFHIIHDGDAYGVGENISDEQILSQIDALNRDFSLSNDDTANIPEIFKPLAANCYIQFCMAKFDPQGNSTTGIERLDFGKASWNTEDEIEDQLKPATIWDRTKYLNIWSCRFGGTLTSQGILAYATLPFFTNNTTDGVVARFNTIGTVGSLMTNYRFGRTIVHEVGHWLGLLHNWGNDDGDCDDGSWNTTDFVDDTPDQANRYFGCPAHPQVSCGSQDMFNNYMDYTDDDCRNMFSVGQADRMRGVLEAGGQRSSFQTAISKCYLSFDGALANIALPADTICALKFKPLVRVKNEGVTTITSGTIVYSIDNGAFQFFSWNGSLGIQQDAFVTLPEITVAQGLHTLNFAFEDLNGSVADDDNNNNAKQISFYAYDGGLASTAPFYNDFEDGLYPPTNWSIENGGNANTWVSSPASGYDVGDLGVVINNLNYTTNPGKVKDGLVTDDYAITTAGIPTLSFDLAYCRHSANRFDSLAVFYSLDCGTTWVKIFDKGGSQLASAPDKTTLFTPLGDQWRTEVIGLSALQGQGKVRFKFVNTSGWGNALYLDNINVTVEPISSVETATVVDVKVFPNPAVNEAIVSLPVVHPFTNIEIYSTIGQKVFSIPVTQRIVNLNTSSLAKGTYFIRLYSEKASQQHHLIIAR